MEGVGGGLIITPWCVEPCRTATLSQKYIWQERTREGEGKMEKKPARELRIGLVEGCGDGAQGVALCSVLYCSPFSPLLGIIRSMNISLITAEKAEWSRVEDACHTALSARITPPPMTLACHTAPCLQPSTYHHVSPSPCPVLTSPLSSLPLVPHLFTLRGLKYYFCLLVHITVSFVSLPPLHPPVPPPCLLALDGLRLFVYYGEC